MHRLFRLLQRDASLCCINLRVEEVTPLLGEVYRRIRRSGLDVVLSEDSRVSRPEVKRELQNSLISGGQHEVTFDVTVNRRLSLADVDAVIGDDHVAEACVAAVTQSDFNFACPERFDKTHAEESPVSVATRACRLGQVPRRVLLLPPQIILSKRRSELLNRISSYKPDADRVVHNGVSSADVELSVVVPVYNREKYVLDALASVVNSKFSKRYELVVVNDASTDNTPALCKDFISKLSMPAKVVDKYVNTHLSHTRNIGIRHSSGDLLFFLDSDNFIGPHCLQKHYDTIQSTNAAVCYAPIQKFQVDQNRTRNLDIVSNEEFNFDRMTKGNYIDAMALIRKSDLEEVGCYATWLLHFGFGHEDYELWLRMHSRSKKFTCARGSCMSFYRVHEVNLTNEIISEGSRVEKLMMKSYSQRLSL